MLNFVRKKSVVVVLSSLLIMSCNTTINSTNLGNSAKEEKSFGIKSVSNTIQNTDLTYTGNWSLNGNVRELSRKLCLRVKPQIKNLLKFIYIIFNMRYRI